MRVGCRDFRGPAHASIAAAGPIDDGFLMVELVDYLDGPGGAVDAVLRLQAARTVSAVVVDGRSRTRRP